MSTTHTYKDNSNGDDADLTYNTTNNNDAGTHIEERNNGNSAPGALFDKMALSSRGRGSSSVNTITSNASKRPPGRPAGSVNKKAGANSNINTTTPSSVKISNFNTTTTAMNTSSVSNTHTNSIDVTCTSTTAVINNTTNSEGQLVTVDPRKELLPIAATSVVPRYFKRKFNPNPPMIPVTTVPRQVNSISWDDDFEISSEFI